MSKVENVHVCPTCWEKMNPGRTPVRVVGARPRFCAICQTPTRDPIGVRMAAQTIQELRS